MSQEAIEKLLSTATIRERANQIYDLSEKGRTHFEIHEENLEKTADLVAKITRENYPRLIIPFHSRWRHFMVGDIDRNKILNKRLMGKTLDDTIRSKLDLAVISVLLDAGAGPTWKYEEKSTGKTFSRSEGLAVASFHMFLNGLFSSNKKNPHQVDATALERLDELAFFEAFQVNEDNPMDGVEGRFRLLKSLARILNDNTDYYDAADGTGHLNTRPGMILDKLKHVAKDGKVQAEDILRAVQIMFGPIWPGRESIMGFNLGDVWRYPPLGSGNDALVPFHKLSQWLTYSLVDPLEESSLKVVGFDRLTALAEYRNGGLLVDMDVLKLRKDEYAEKPHEPGSELIIEWRALTIVLMEKLAELVRKRLRKTPEDLPLGKVLEGGTWWAGRQIAKEKREDGSPPIKIISDGTVF